MSAGPGTPGLLDTARGLLANVVALAQTRIELAGTEIREEIARTGLVMISALTAWFFAAMAIAFAALAVILAAGEGYRIQAAMAITVLFLAGGGVAAWLARRFATAKPRMLDATLSELQRDYELIRPRP